MATNVNITQIGPENLVCGDPIDQDVGAKIVRRPLLDLVKGHSQRYLIFDILDVAGFGLFDPAGAEESAAEDPCGVGSCDLSPVPESKFALAYIFEAERVKPRVNFEIVKA